MPNVMKIQCLTHCPAGFLDSGNSVDTVYLLTTTMKPKNVEVAMSEYWRKTEAVLIEIVSTEIVPMPEFTFADHVSTYDGKYGKGFLIVDNYVARTLLAYLRGTLWGSTEKACAAYNWATNPSYMRNEKEHKACERMARLCLKKLKGKNYKENEDGRLVSLEKDFWK